MIQALASGLLLMICWAASFWCLAVVLVLYNCVAESFFVIAATSLGLDLQQTVFASPTSVHASSPDTDTDTDGDGDPDRASTLDPRCVVTYHRWLLLTLCSKFLGSFVIEIMLQLVLYPTWGTLSNIFGIQLDLTHRLYAFAIFGAGVFAGLTAIGLMRGIQLCHRRACH